MLVIISDLHLSDGSRDATVSYGAMEIFARRLCELAVEASWRADGNYRPIERIDIVLLGDVFDVVRSTEWLASPTLRPWSDPQSAEFCDAVSRITGRIVEKNEELMAILRALTGPAGVTVPPALRAGRPAPNVDQVPVAVKIHAMVGDADWFYQLRGAL